MTDSIVTSGEASKLMEQNKQQGGGTTSTTTPSILPKLVSASTGSIITALAVTPLEVVKVRQQASVRDASEQLLMPSNVTRCPRGCGTFVLNNGLLECVVPKSAVPYFDSLGHLTPKARELFQEATTINNTNHRRRSTGGILTMLRRIFRTEGLGGIYAGLAPTMVMSVPNTVLYFTAYDEISAQLRQRRGSSTTAAASSTYDYYYSHVLVPLLSGSSARLMASFATAPLELLRTRQASVVGSSANGSGPGLIEEFRLLVRSDGFLSLYRGWIPTLWRDVPFSAIYWLFLERFKEILAAREHNESSLALTVTSAGQDKSITPLVQAGHAFVSGAAAGMIAAAATTPFDVVKTRTQMTAVATVACDHGGAAAYNHHHHHSQGSLMTQMLHIARTEGIRGLWRGNNARMIKVAPACAIMISCYEFGKRILE